MAFSKKIMFDNIRYRLGTELVSDAWFSVGTAMDHQARTLTIKNTTNETLYFSFFLGAAPATADLTNTQLVLPTNGYEILDVTANKTGLNQGFFGGKGDRLYVRRSGAAPTSGYAFFEVTYGKDE